MTIIAAVAVLVLFLYKLYLMIDRQNSIVTSSYVTKNVDNLAYNFTTIGFNVKIQMAVPMDPTYGYIQVNYVHAFSFNSTTAAVYDSTLLEMVPCPD